MGYEHYVGGDSESDEIRQGDGFVVVCGYGRIGRLVCELLGKKFINFVAFDNNPLKAMEARNRYVVSLGDRVLGFLVFCWTGRRGPGERGEGSFVSYSSIIVHRWGEGGKSKILWRLGQFFCRERTIFFVFLYCDGCRWKSSTINSVL